MKPPLQKLTEDELEALIEKEDYLEVGTTTICLMRLNSGFQLVGTSACINPDDFNEVFGKQLARNKAFDRLWELEAYHRMRAHEKLDGL